MVELSDPTSPEMLAIREYLELVMKVHENLLDVLDYHKVNLLQSDKNAFELYLMQQIEQVVVSMKVVQSTEEIRKLVQSVFDEVVGFGPVEPLFRDEVVTDIFINGPDSVYVEKKRTCRAYRCSFFK